MPHARRSNTHEWRLALQLAAKSGTRHSAAYAACGIGAIVSQHTCSIAGAELPVIQTLLGHADPRDTMIYLHLATRKLREAPNPLETLRLASAPDGEPAAS